mmetsp:Transcript_77/g.155  ORF Transcript_77/g.155 Transcript_77/m.155 type:complete len:150 (+) Transcript_77:617-1066(+)
MLRSNKERILTDADNRASTNDPSLCEPRRRVPEAATTRTPNCDEGSYQTRKRLELSTTQQTESTGVGHAPSASLSAATGSNFQFLNYDYDDMERGTKSSSSSSNRVDNDASLIAHEMDNKTTRVTTMATAKRAPRLTRIKYPPPCRAAK